MKSFNVKSNAKRFAKQLAGKFPGYIVDEPVAVSPGAREWYPHVAAPSKVLAEGIPAEISRAAFVNGRPYNETAARLAEPTTVIAGTATGRPVETTMTVAEAAKGYSVAVPPAAIIEAGNKMAKSKAKPAKMTPADMKAAVADLPPTKSTPEEIEARRAARRQRIATEGPKPAKSPKQTKAAKIIELVSRENGATFAELIEGTEWQAHTLRGYIAGTLRKKGHNIVCRKIKGEETRYLIPAPEVSA
ncbi:DUF3489 domain-containing protein [Mesorhizobium sp. CA14]|uniref:DUF3489 domain-containing protein n=1 Tax=Mesorhizobium sp. CA14 TaxID=2876642 RepID=UPI001CCF7B91|nr:DUF3489 domain-containing protein [Mesorhizobium sp. CA14]MBZ9847214.1 DUF3489 domain-containing protein [Mesorhizobium sp. CA14]